MRLFKVTGTPLKPSLKGVMELRTKITLPVCSQYISGVLSNTEDILKKWGDLAISDDTSQDREKLKEILKKAFMDIKNVLLTTKTKGFLIDAVTDDMKFSNQTVSYPYNVVAHSDHPFEWSLNFTWAPPHISIPLSKMRGVKSRGNF